MGYAAFVWVDWAYQYKSFIHILTPKYSQSPKTKFPGGIIVPLPFM